MSIRLDGASTVNTGGNRNWLRNVSGGTVLAWVTIDSFALSRSVWGAFAPTSTSRLKLSTLATGQITVRAVSLDADATSAVDGVASLTLGKRHHIAAAVSYTTKTASLYIDGALDTTGVFANMTAGNTSDTASLISRLGSNEQGSANRWLGELEDVRVYDRLLGPNEILTIYTSLGKDGITNGLQARWPLNELGMGEAMVSMADLSVNGFGGAPQGSVIYQNSFVSPRKRFGR